MRRWILTPSLLSYVTVDGKELTVSIETDIYMRLFGVLNGIDRDPHEWMYAGATRVDRAVRDAEAARKFIKEARVVLQIDQCLVL